MDSVTNTLSIYLIFMEKKFLLTVILTSFCRLDFFAQVPSINLLKVKTSINYFSGLDIMFKPFNHLPFSVEYVRYVNSKPLLLGGKLYHYRFSDHNHPELKKKGDVLAKFFIVGCIQVGYKVNITQKKLLSANIGLNYRIGREEQFLSVIQISPGSYEEFSTLYKYRNLGLEVTAEQQFEVSRHWSFNIGGGYQYFITRTTTNHHLWISAGLGHAF